MMLACASIHQYYVNKAYTKSTQEHQWQSSTSSKAESYECKLFEGALNHKPAPQDYFLGLHYFALYGIQENILFISRQKLNVFAEIRGGVVTLRKKRKI